MFQRYSRCTFFLIRNAGNPFCQSGRNVWLNKSLFVEQQAEVDDLSSNLKRTVPLTANEFMNLKHLKPSQPENPHLLKVSILGEPNVGKSTLTNRLVKWRVCAVSRKVHTTRRKTRAVLVEGNIQIVFLDTPGFVTPEKTKKHSLEPSFVMDPMKSIREADLIAVVVDISDRFTNNRINPEILRVLYDFKHKKSILILNKVDAMKSKDRLLSLTRILTTDVPHKDKDADTKEISTNQVTLETSDTIINVNDEDSDFYENIENKRGWPLFAKVFMVSALKNDGIEDLRNYMLNEAVSMDWLFHEGMVTDQHPHDIVLNTVRENLLEYLPNEIPYKLDLKITKWEMLSTGCPKIDIKIKCPNSRHRSFVIGPEGKHIAVCVARCKKALRESFRRDVVLKVAVA